jgi:hypothetical protein
MEANSLWRKYLHHRAQNVVYAGVTSSQIIKGFRFVIPAQAGIQFFQNS